MRSRLGGAGMLVVVGVVACAYFFSAHPDAAQDPAGEQIVAVPGEAIAAGAWTCSWDPTINDDWHDDYLCSDGVSVDRPYLLPDDPYVEKWELDAAAADHAAALNG